MSGMNLTRRLERLEAELEVRDVHGGRRVVGRIDQLRPVEEGLLHVAGAVE